MSCTGFVGCGILDIPDEIIVEMLVENTPHVAELTLISRSRELEANEIWDLYLLSLIQGWKNLRSLRLLSIPISDGKFLIEIGKQCEFIEKLEFYDLGSSHNCCYAKELSTMLSHCPNLEDFSMKADNIGQVSEVFVSLAKNLKLRRVRFKSNGKMINDTASFISSVEQLLRHCSNLTTFVCILDGIFPVDSLQLTSVLRRLRSELDRPSLQFQLTPSKAAADLEKVFEDSLIPSYPYTWEVCNYF